MIYILFGGDELSLEERLDALKAAIEPEELRDVNISTLSGQELDFERLRVLILTSRRCSVTISLGAVPRKKIRERMSTRTSSIRPRIGTMSCTTSNGEMR